MIGYNITVKGPKNPLFQEHDSVMLGEISPHHDYCDSKLSSETPPSYNQLNYNEKIEKFFNSNILMNTNYGSDGDNINLSAQNSDNNYNTSPKHTSSKCTLQNHDSSGSGSGENFSNELNNKMSILNKDGKDGNSSNDNFKLPKLTESLLNKHNQNMEHLIMLQHKEKRLNIKNNKSHGDGTLNNGKSVGKKKLIEKKNSKKRHYLNSKNSLPIKTSKMNNGTKKIAKIDDGNNIQTNKVNQIEKKDTNENNTNENFSSKELVSSVVPNILPIYYFPVSNIQENHMMMLVTPPQITNGQLSSTGSINQTNNNISYEEPTTKFIFPQVIGNSTTASMIYTPSIFIKIPIATEELAENTSKNLENNNKNDSQVSNRPESQATSVKAQPGSIMAISESSKKILLTDKNISSINTQKETIESSMNDSSDSSFYASFLDSSSENSSLEKQKTKHDDITNKRCRHFSMINDMKANFERHQLEINNDLLKKQKVVVNKNYTDNAKIQQEKMIKIASPCLKDVDITPDLIYRYQMTTRPLHDILEADMIALRNTTQPQLVNEQLDQLCIDFELNRFDNKLIIESSNSSSDLLNNQQNDIPNNNQDKILLPQKLARQQIKESIMSMIYEENAPFPMI